MENESSWAVATLALSAFSAVLACSANLTLLFLQTLEKCPAVPVKLNWSYLWTN